MSAFNFLSWSPFSSLFQRSATSWNCGWKRSENRRQILQIWQHDWAEMCNQQNTATNKLCYLETRFEDAELWHESRWNQVGERIVLRAISTSAPCPRLLCVAILWLYRNFLWITAWKRTSTQEVPSADCMLRMQIALIVETTLVPWVKLQKQPLPSMC
jgi:hypothetical protein